MPRLLAMGLLTLAVLLVATACAATEAVPAQSTNTTATSGTIPDAGVASAVGPGISVSEALDSALTGPLLVNGFIITDAGGTVYLAELLAESLPPLPGGPQLIVEGLDLDSFPGLTSAQGIIWSDQPVQLLGDVRNGVMTVSMTSSA